MFRQDGMICSRRRTSTLLPDYQYFSLEARDARHSLGGYRAPHRSARQRAVSCPSAPAGTGHRALASESESSSSTRNSPQPASVVRYWIGVDNVSGGNGSQSPFVNPISVSGNLSATDYAGQPSQYHVQIDWGDGVVEPNAILDVPPEPPDNKSFIGRWYSPAPPHIYSQSGNHTISATLYHQKFAGNEKSDMAVATVTIAVVSPSIDVTRRQLLW